MISHSSQDPIEILVGASKSTMNVALNILLVNYHRLLRFPVFPGNDALGIVQLTGPSELITQHTSLARSKFAMSDASSFFKSLPSYLSQLEGLKSSTASVTPQQIFKFCQSIITFGIGASVTLLNPSLVEFISAVMLDVLTAQSCKLPAILLDNQVLAALRKLSLVYPYLEISLCPKCVHFGLLVGSYPIGNDNCLRCGSCLVCARVFLIDPRLSILKEKNNKDLPLFISKYIFNATGGQLFAEPHKCFPPDTEIDVYLEQSQKAIECRLYLHEASGWSEQQIRSEAGTLSNEIKTKHSNSKIQRFSVITNLSKGDSSKLEQEVKRRLSKDGIPVSLTVVPGEISVILQHLDEEIARAIS